MGMGWMDGGIDGMDGWDGGMDGMEGWLDRWMKGWDGMSWMDGWVDGMGWKNGWTDGLGWMNGWVDGIGWMNGMGICAKAYRADILHLLEVSLLNTPESNNQIICSILENLVRR